MFRRYRVGEAGGWGFEALETRMLLSGAVLQALDANGLVVLDADDADVVAASASHAWTPFADPRFSNGSALRADPDAGVTYEPDRLAESPSIAWEVRFNRAGTHYLWLRGNDAGGDSDSLHVGLNGATQPDSDRVWIRGTGWSSAAYPDPQRLALNVPSAGVHTVTVWMRQGGVVFDQLVLTSDASYVPPNNAALPPSAREFLTTMTTPDAPRLRGESYTDPAGHTASATDLARVATTLAPPAAPVLAA